MEYSYPFSTDWSTEEVISVVAFFEAIEQAYEKGIVKEELMERYKRFKEIVPGKADEKRICDEFEEVSGYSSYRAIQKMKQSPDQTKIRM
ncbi:UPF0223 family protein [Domibacillus indicus]|uniref:UPF0223 family protein n=1 Tax=Domibacillus indicus TaxID=1437523 RepID=UPI0006183637|nr:UPF0223 family protein [Domibacillus indicus]